jgi:general secretion pathway protein J
MMTHPQQPSQREAGFTLIELLVAIALIGLLSVVLFGGLRFGVRATERTTAAADHSSQLALAFGVLQSQLGNAQPFPASPEPQNHQIIFDGLPTQLEAITTAPSFLAAGGFFRLRLAAIGDSGQVRLVSEWGNPPRRGQNTSEATLQPSILLEHMRAIRFAYFGKTDPEDPDDWHDEWQTVTTLPKMIRLRVQFSDGWQAPDLIVAPRLAAEPSASG